MSLKLKILTWKITKSKKQLNYICLNGQGSSYGRLWWFEKEEDCQTQIKCNTIFPLVQSCLPRLREMSCWAAALLLVPSPLPSSTVNVLPLLQSPSYTYNLPWFSLTLYLFFFTSWLIGVKSLLTFLAIGSPFPPPSHPFVTFLVLPLCKDATGLRKSLNHKLLNLVVCLSFSYALS